MKIIFMNAWDDDDQASPPALSLSSLPRVCGSVYQAQVRAGRYLQPWPEPGPLRD